MKLVAWLDLNFQAWFIVLCEVASKPSALISLIIIKVTSWEFFFFFCKNTTIPLPPPFSLLPLQENFLAFCFFMSGKLQHKPKPKLLKANLFLEFLKSSSHTEGNMLGGEKRGIRLRIASRQKWWRKRERKERGRESAGSVSSWVHNLFFHNSLKGNGCQGRGVLMRLRSSGKHVWTQGSHRNTGVYTLLSMGCDRTSSDQCWLKNGE